MGCNYKILIISMIKKMDPEDEEIFLRQIYTIIRKHEERKTLTANKEAAST